MVKEKGASSTPPNAQSCPWLMFSHGKSHGKSHLIQTFYSIPDNCCLKRELSPLSRNTILANCDGWAVITAEESKDGYLLSCFLLHLISMEKILLPSFEDFVYHTCLLSSSPLRPDCVVAFIGSIDGEDRSQIKFWRPTQDNWVEVFTEPRLRAPFLTCHGKIYGTQYYYGFMYFVMVDMHDNEVQVHRQIKMPETTFAGSIRRNAFLIESCGEFFVVTKYMLGVVGKRARAVQVYKLREDKNTTKMDWIRVNDIGDRAFFIQKRINGFPCSATQSSLKGNSIYFIGDGRDDTHMYRYNLLDNRCYKTLPCLDVAHHIKQICWVTINHPAGPGL